MSAIDGQNLDAHEAGRYVIEGEFVPMLTIIGLPVKIRAPS